MNEEQLIRDLRAGAREALRLLYESHKDRLFTLARGLLGDTSGAEDVVHDVFLGFVASLPRYHVNGGLGAYLATSVANRARDRLRAVKRHAASSAGLEGGGKLDEAPEAQAILQEETHRLKQALAKLPYEQREVVLLHLQGDLTFQKIADLQGVSLSTAQGRYRYGLEKLRSQLKKQFDEINALRKAGRCERTFLKEVEQDGVKVRLYQVRYTLVYNTPGFWDQ